jgi:NAD(P)-dependent dehydrogenase (short-subunit alcohol dehydrogenase family)
MTQEAVLITGGTSGIGRATAELLHERGIAVMVTGSSDESVAAARAQLPGEINIVRADTASLDDTARVVHEAKAAFGVLTGLFLNAGIFSASPIEAVNEATWNRLFEVNAKGQFFTLQKALPLLTDGASVVVTVGIGATRGMAGSGVAAGSRGALLTMIPSFAVELAPRRIRVNAVSPGAIDTPIMGKSRLRPEQVMAVKQSMAAGIPFQRLGDAREVATTVAFLLSDDASYITGENVVVGGGAGLRL